MTTENLPSAPLSLRKRLRLTTQPRSNSRFGILPARKDTSPWHPCTTATPTAPSLFTTSLKPYALATRPYHPPRLSNALTKFPQASLDKAKAWVKELQRQANENIIIALAGNKLDLVTEQPDKRAVTTHDAQTYANEAGLLFFETSAKTAENVKELFTAIAKKLPIEQASQRGIRGAPRPGVDLRPEASGTQAGQGCNC